MKKTLEIETNKNTSKQIDINICFEDMLDNYKAEIKKLNYKINYNKQRINSYKKKVVKAESYKVDENIRQAIYITTCNSMIEKCNNKIESICKEKEDKLIFMKDNIISLLNEGLCNDFLDLNLFIKKDEHTVYNLPSARFLFNSEIIIESEKLFKSYLFSNNLDYYNNSKIDFDNFIKDSNLSISEDRTIINNEDGQIINGLVLNYDIDILFID